MENDIEPPNRDDGNEGEEEEEPQKERPLLRLATLNIIDGRRNWLNSALRCMKQMNIDVGDLTETKFHNNMYTKYAEDYSVVGTTTHNNTGGIELIHRKSKEWGLESIRTFGLNVIRATLISGQRR